jgi:dienelactone hydrolase
MRTRIQFCFVFMAAVVVALAQGASTLPGTATLTNTGDLSAQMVEGVDRWLMRETERVATNRTRMWIVDPENAAGWTALKQSKRERLREIIGAVDPLVAAPRLQFMGDDERGAEVFRSSGPRPFAAYRVRWPVFENFFGEGLLLVPLGENGKPAQSSPAAIAIPDADQSPEELAGLRPGIPPASQYARHLVESGWRVLVPALVNRDDTFSGNPRLGRFTNQPHREWIYRQAYEMGRHIVGYEVQQVLAGVTALQSSRNVAIAGYGEGGWIALHAAALDARIDAVFVSGCFGPREQLWREPIYRNAFGYLREFGDAELAALIAPRKLIVEFSQPPKVNGPPAARSGRGGAAPGVIAPMEFGDVEIEIDRANSMAVARKGGPFVELVHGSEGSSVQFGSRKALAALAQAQGVTNQITFDLEDRKLTAVALVDVTNRQQRLVRGLETLTQDIFRRSERVRDERIWKLLGKTNEFMAAAAGHRRFFDQKVMGKIEATRLPPNVRTRQIYDKPAWTGYEVMLDVFPDVFAWGYLLVPKDLKPGERRPVVVCQHGLEGVPEDTVADDPKHKGYGPYKAFAAGLAERGFIVYAPHNPYRGQDKFRVLQRKANPLGLSLFSFIIAQHEVTTDWLASLPFVDAQRIAFYGLSYGGKTAMRVPAVIERYCLSICSADFNEWVQKCVTTESPYSYMFTGEYEMPEWNLGHTFNYAEMASLIAPRPFMVERGHDDGVAPDTWVAYEFAKVQRMYDKLGIGDRTGIEFFNGPHTINGAGTFKFLHRHLNFPERP